MQHVADGLAEAVALLRVDDVPGRAPSPGRTPAGRRTPGSAGWCACGTRCRTGCPAPIGTRSASTSSTALRVPSTVMSSRAENRCWWNGAPSPGATSVAYSCRRGARGEHDPGRLDLELDGAVEVEVPVEAVVVVADRGEEGDHQPALPAHLAGPGEQVGVLPEDPVVLLVHADRVGDRLRVAEVVGDHRVRCSGCRRGSRSPAAASRRSGRTCTRRSRSSSARTAPAPGRRRAPPSRPPRPGRRSVGRRRRSGAGSGPHAR